MAWSGGQISPFGGELGLGHACTAASPLHGRGHLVQAPPLWDPVQPTFLSSLIKQALLPAWEPGAGGNQELLFHGPTVVRGV